MQKSLPVVFVAITLTLLSFRGSAGMDWLQKGKDLLGDVAGDESAQDQLSSTEIGAGLKEALRVGTESVVSRLGKPDGFNSDPSIHIPLPDSLKPVQSGLDKVGMGSVLDDLEVRLNRAAEVATPKAKQLFWTSISEMSIDDVKAIYKGSDDAATRYFQSKMTPQLSQEMAPIVEQSLSEVGAVQTYDRALGQYRTLPFVPDVKADLTGYVVDKGMDGIFHYLAIKEAEIRTDPAKQTTELLKRVFGSQ